MDHTNNNSCDNNDVPSDEERIDRTAKKAIENQQHQTPKNSDGVTQKYQSIAPTNCTQFHRRESEHQPSQRMQQIKQDRTGIANNNNNNEPPQHPQSPCTSPNRSHSKSRRKMITSNAPEDWGTPLRAPPTRRRSSRSGSSHVESAGLLLHHSSPPTFLSSPRQRRRRSSNGGTGGGEGRRRTVSWNPNNYSEYHKNNKNNEVADFLNNYSTPPRRLESVDSLSLESSSLDNGDEELSLSGASSASLSGCDGGDEKDEVEEYSSNIVTPKRRGGGNSRLSSLQIPIEQPCSPPQLHHHHHRARSRTSSSGSARQQQQQQQRHDSGNSMTDSNRSSNSNSHIPPQQHHHLHNYRVPGSRGRIMMPIRIALVTLAYIAVVTQRQQQPVPSVANLLAAIKPTDDRIPMPPDSGAAFSTQHGREVAFTPLMNTHNDKNASAAAAMASVTIVNENGGRPSLIQSDNSKAYLRKGKQQQQQQPTTTTKRRRPPQQPKFAFAKSNTAPIFGLPKEPELISSSSRSSSNTNKRRVERFVLPDDYQENENNNVNKDNAGGANSDKERHPNNNNNNKFEQDYIDDDGRSSEQETSSSLFDMLLSLSSTTRTTIGLLAWIVVVVVLVETTCREVSRRLMYIQRRIWYYICGGTSSSSNTNSISSTRIHSR